MSLILAIGELFGEMIYIGKLFETATRPLPPYRGLIRNRVLRPRIAYLIMITLYQEIYPLRFYGILHTALFFIGSFIGIIPIIEYLDTGLAIRFPTAFPAASFEVSASIILVAAVIMVNISTLKRENRIFFYLLESYNK